MQDIKQNWLEAIKPENMTSIYTYIQRTTVDHVQIKMICGQYFLR